MADHGGKEDRIEPGKWTVEARDQSPSHCEEEIAGVVYLSSIAIYASRLLEVSRNEDGI